MSVRNASGNCSAGNKNACGGVILSSGCWICLCVFGYLNSHNYVEEKLVFLRTSTPVGTWTLSSWRDFRNILHGVSTVFVVSVFVILCLVFLLTPLFWFWCDSSNYAIIYVYLSVCHCVRVSALSAHLQVDQNTEIFSRAPGKHTTHQTTTQNWNVALYPVIEQ